MTIQVFFVFGQRMRQVSPLQRIVTQTGTSCSGFIGCVYAESLPELENSPFNRERSQHVQATTGYHWHITNASACSILQRSCARRPRLTSKRLPPEQHTADLSIMVMYSGSAQKSTKNPGCALCCFALQLQPLVDIIGKMVPLQEAEC